MLLVFACKGKPGSEAGPTPGKDSATGVLLNADSSFIAQFKGPYTEYGIFGFKDYEVRIQSFYYYDDNHDDYGKAVFILLRDPAKKVADTIMLEADDDYTEDVEVDDMSDSLKFKSLVLKVSSTGASDVPIDEFVEYKDGELKSLFTIEYLRKIRRINDRYLAAVVEDRDDVFGWFYDQPATIDLRYLAVEYHIPDTQVIKYPTTTLEPITVYKQRGEVLSEPVNIKTGTPVVVDTFFRKTGIMRMMLPDSTPVFILKDEIREKVQGNAAG